MRYISGMLFSDSDLRARLPKSQGYVLSLRKQAIRLVLSPSDDQAIAVGASKVGGLPDLPASVEWPILNERPLSFLAQIRLDEASSFDQDALLPKTGLLSFFLESRPILASSGAEKNVAPMGLILHGASDPAMLSRAKEPSFPSASASASASSTLPIVHRASAVSFATMGSFPREMSPFMVIEGIHKSERAAYRALLEEVRQSPDADRARSSRQPADKMLGYADFDDEHQVTDGDSRLLLQLSPPSPDGALQACVSFFGQDAAIRAGNFRNARLIFNPNS
ncbi:MAG: hypothetical protein NVS3B20_14430 [Polyangiales bacterium]